MEKILIEFRESWEKLYKDNYILAKWWKWLGIYQMNKCEGWKEREVGTDILDRRIEGTDEI